MNLHSTIRPFLEPEFPAAGMFWIFVVRAADAGWRSPVGRDAGRRGAPRQRRLGGLRACT